jgi:hypothetical protein
MRIILFLLAALFLISDNISAMNAHEFRVLEDLRSVDPMTVRKNLKIGFTEVVLGGGLVVLAPYVPSLGATPGSYRNDKPNYDLVSPTTVKVLGKTLVLNGARKFISAAHEEYNILRGCRLPENERTLSLNIRNGIVDIGLAGAIYVSHQYIPSLLMESYVELAGPAVTIVAVSCLGMRGLTDLARDLPTWAGELDWSLTACSLKDKAMSGCATFFSFFTKKEREHT